MRKFNICFRGQQFIVMMAAGLSAFWLFVGGWIVFPGLFILQLHFWSKTVLGRRLKKQYDLTDKDCSDIANKYAYHILIHTQYMHIDTIVVTFMCHKYCGTLSMNSSVCNESLKTFKQCMCKCGEFSTRFCVVKAESL